MRIGQLLVVAHISASLGCPEPPSGGDVDIQCCEGEGEGEGDGEGVGDGEGEGEASTCGNGLLEIAEACDDGDLDAGDGCNAVCRTEAGWACGGLSPSFCSPACGDGALVGAEECDDGNVVDDGNGCSASCTRIGECGDGLLQTAFEQCDDGDDLDVGNGCGETCIVNAFCGDGVVQDLYELCDDGASYPCSSDCDQLCALPSPPIDVEVFVVDNVTQFRVCDATVTLADPPFSLALSQTGSTASDCSYVAAMDRTGIYQLDVLASGYQPFSVSGIELEVQCGDPTSRVLNVRLTPN